MSCDRCRRAIVSPFAPRSSTSRSSTSSRQLRSSRRAATSPMTVCPRARARTHTLRNAKVMSSWLRLQALHDESIGRGATTEDKLIRNGRGGPPIGVAPPYAWKLKGYEDPLARVESRVAHVCHRLKDSMSVQCAHSLSARPALPTVRPCGPLRATVRRGRGGQAEAGSATFNGRGRNGPMGTGPAFLALQNIDCSLDS